MDLEKRAYSDFDRLCGEAVALASPVWHHGDGNGGELIYRFMRIMRNHGALVDVQKKQTYTKKQIPARLRIAVFERDMYRCVFCNDYRNLTIDHIHPEVKGGSLSMDNLQTLCKSCNSTKGIR